MIISAIPYTGNKRKVWKHLKPLIDTSNKTFVDIMTGGGTVALNVQASTNMRVIANDFNEDIYKIHKGFQLEGFPYRVSMVDSLFGKSKEDFLKLRDGYNNNKERYPEVLLNLLYRSNSNMYRVNGGGKFNMTCGHRQSTNKKRIEEHYNVCQGITFTNLEYTEACFWFLQKDDLSDHTFYFDPPYTNCVATYNEATKWGEREDKEMLDYIVKLVDKGAQVILSNVFKNRGKVNQHLMDWCEEHKQKFSVKKVPINYKNSSFNKTDKETTEVLIYSTRGDKFAEEAKENG